MYVSSVPGQDMAATLHLGPESDTHLCLNCNMTVVGLERYAEHCRSQHDNHLCLMCQHSICGLEQYIKHKTDECHVIKDWRNKQEDSQASQVINSNSGECDVIKDWRTTEDDSQASQGINSNSGECDVIKDWRTTEDDSQASHDINSNSGEIQRAAKKQTVNVWHIPEIVSEEVVKNEVIPEEEYADNNDDVDDANSIVDYNCAEPDTSKHQGAGLTGDINVDSVDVTRNKPDTSKHQGAGLTGDINMDSVDISRNKPDTSKHQGAGLTGDINVDSVDVSSNKPDTSKHQGVGLTGDINVDSVDVSRNKPDTSKHQGAAITGDTKDDDIPWTLHAVTPDTGKPKFVFFTKLRSCSLCEIKVSRSSEAHKHLQTRKHKEKSTRCQVDDILTHQVSLVYSCAFNCEPCQFFCNRLEDFKLHIHSLCHSEHTTKYSENLKHTCGSCSYVSMSTQDFMSHYESQEHQHIDKGNSSKISVVKAVLGLNIGKYECPQCLTHVDTIAALQSHTDQKHAYTCTVCSARFTEERSRQHHEKRHSKGAHNDAWYECSICPAMFMDEQKRQQHESKHCKSLTKDTYIYKCGMCPAKFTDEKKKQLHEIGHSVPLSEGAALRQDPYFGIDPKYHSFIDTLKLSSSKKMACPEDGCSKLLMARDLYSHLRIHTQSEPFHCCFCEAKFSYPRSLQRHLQAVHLDIRDFTCTKCGESFIRNSHLVSHMTRRHGTDDGEESMCDVCGETFTAKHWFKQHKHKHTDKKYTCSEQGCHFKTRIAQVLKQHVISVHTVQRPYPCSQCSYASKSPRYLRKHIHRVHATKRDLKCNQCQYVTYEASKLRRHMITHTSHKPYKCPYCNYSCNCSENLKKHIKVGALHKGLYVYPCPYRETCPYGTDQAKDMRKHLVDLHEVDEQKLASINLYLGHYNKSEDITKLPRRPRRVPRPVTAPMDDVSIKVALENVRKKNNT